MNQIYQGGRFARAHAFLLALAACALTVQVWAQPAASTEEIGQVNVLASIRPLALLVEEVAGDRAPVDVLIGGGASPHSYSLRVSDMRKIQSTDLLVWLGPDFERFLSKPVAQLDAPETLALGEVPGAAEGSQEGEMHSHHAHGDDHHDHPADSHLWLSPAKAELMLEAITQRLAELRPEEASQYRANLAQARQRVAAASQEVRDMLAPVADRPFGVSHDAYGHFADFFGLKQAAAVSAMPDQALSAGHMRDTLKALNDASCLIVEPSESASTIKRLERLFKLPTVKADHLALDPAISSYPDLIRQLGKQFRQCLES